MSGRLGLSGLLCLGAGLFFGFVPGKDMTCVALLALGCLSLWLGGYNSRLLRLGMIVFGVIALYCTWPVCGFGFWAAAWLLGRRARLAGNPEAALHDRLGNLRCRNGFTPAVKNYARGFAREPGLPDMAQQASRSFCRMVQDQLDAMGSNFTDFTLCFDITPQRVGLCHQESFFFNDFGYADVKDPYKRAAIAWFFQEQILEQVRARFPEVTILDGVWQDGTVTFQLYASTDRWREL